MSFFSLTFLILYFPACLLLYYCTPDKLKNTMLLCLSLFFYYTLEPGRIWLLIGCAAVDYLLGQVLRRWREHRWVARSSLALSVGKSLLLVVGYGMQAYILAEGSFLPPAGLLVYSLSSISYLTDVYWGELPAERNPVDFLLYCCFFGRIFAGPYVRYSIIRPQLKHHRLSLSSVSTGLILLIQGVAKKVILADNLMATYQQIKAITYWDCTLLSAWSLLVYLLLGIFFTLSAYCDVARGLGQIFSFKLPRNLSYPLAAKSVREFVASFNSTFYEFLRIYVYRPLGGRKAGVLLDVLNTMLVMMLFGMWFGLSPHAIMWGGALGLLVLGEKYIYGKLLHRLPALIGHIYTLLAVTASLVLLSQSRMTDIIDQFELLHTFTRGKLYNNQIIYILSQNYWMLIPAVIFSLPFARRIDRFVKTHFMVLSNFISVGVNLGLLLISIMFMI